MSGQLQKMKVIAYSDPEFNEKIEDGEFVTLVNPESYTFNYIIETEDEQAPGTSAVSTRFNKILPEEMDFDFIFDSTGAIPGSSSGEDIIEDVERLKRIALEYDGESHKPNYVKISWGTLLFKGSLTELSITFKLFKPDGTPIRATANGKFKGFVEDNLRVAKENAQSPDLTHFRVVKAGDKLPLMCHRIYGDSKYYLQVAEKNNLINFRKLKVGESIFFPPINKSSVG